MNGAESGSTQPPNFKPNLLVLTLTILFSQQVAAKPTSLYCKASAVTVFREKKTQLADLFPKFYQKKKVPFGTQ
jgi:hypothetical protein